MTDTTSTLAALGARPTDADMFRKLWRGFGTTVALIATNHGGSRHAMLATAATSVSMDPPSLLICVNRAASAYPALVARGSFSLGILSSDRHGICAHIARAAGPERFAEGDWMVLADEGEATDGLPWLAEAQATLFCEIDASLDYGTHRLFIARVTRAAGTFGGDPLLYCDGRFGRFMEMVQ